MPPLRMRYHVATAGSNTALHKAVEQQMRKGWRPFGGVALAMQKTGRMVYAQAVVKGVM